MGNLIITDANGKIIEQSHIEPAKASGERKKDASPMKENGVVQFHRAFARERMPWEK